MHIWDYNSYSYSYKFIYSYSYKFIYSYIHIFIMQSQLDIKNNKMDHPPKSEDACRYETIMWIWKHPGKKQYTCDDPDIHDMPTTY